MVKELKNDTFRDAIKNGTVFVKVMSQFCGPCKTYAPIFDKFAEENKNIECFTINGLEEADFSCEYKIKAVPVTIIFKDGVEVKRFSGVQTKETLESMI